MRERMMASIAGMARVELHPWPTPFMAMAGLTATMRSAVVSSPVLWVKREDLTSLGAGGNKVRKLEFVLGKALAEGCDVLLNTGDVQSNQVVQTAAAAARLGIPCELFVTRTTPPLSEDDEETGNMLLNRLLGAAITMVAPGGPAAAEVMAERAAALRSAGRRPFVVPRGASTPEGDAGAVLGLFELLDQAETAGIVPDGIVLSVGSAGTAAGYLTGLTALALAGRQVPRLYAGDAFGPLYPTQARQRIMHHAEACWSRLQLPGTCQGAGAEAILHLDTESVGPGYCQPYQELVDTIELVAAHEGIILDPNYTGKAVTGFFRRIRNNEFTAGQNIVYLHSGGLPALFAMRRMFAKGHSPLDSIHS